MAKNIYTFALQIIVYITELQDNDLLSPGIIINSSPSGSGSGSGLSLEGSRHLSRSNIDIPRCSSADDPKKQLPRKRSDSSTYELDTIKQHQAFLSRSDAQNSSVRRTLVYPCPKNKHHI